MNTHTPCRVLVGERVVWTNDETAIAEVQARYSDQAMIAHIQSVIRQADVNGCMRAVVLLVGNEGDMHSVHTADFQDRRPDNSVREFRYVSRSQQRIEALAAGLARGSAVDLTAITVLENFTGSAQVPPHIPAHPAVQG